MKRFTTLFLVLTVIFTMFIPGTIETAAATGESISLMTYNVTAFGVAGEELADYFPDSSLYISKRYQQVFDVMKMPDGTDPDIFCLQEVNNTWISYFNQEFVVKRGYELYGYSSNGGSLYTCNGQWDLVNVIGFKKDKYTAIDKGHFWCSETPSVVSTYSGGDFARCINWVKLQSKETGRQFFVTSAHIDAKSSSVRELSTAQIASTMNSIANGLPVIIMGDFNCKSSTAACKKITSANYVNTQSIASSSDSSVTYNSWGRNSGSIIDHCFLTKDMFTVSQYKVITTKMSNGYAPSDHYPVAIEAVLNSPITSAATPTPTPTRVPVSDFESTAVVDINFANSTVVDSKGKLALSSDRISSTAQFVDVSSYGASGKGLVVSSVGENLKYSGNVTLGNAFAYELYGVFSGSGELLVRCNYPLETDANGNFVAWTNVGSVIGGDAAIATTSGYDKSKAHHIVVTGNVNTYSIYVDGKLAATRSLNIPDSWNLSDGTIYIGGQSSVPTSHIMRFRVFSAAPSASDVQKMYAAYSSGTSSATATPIATPTAKPTAKPTATPTAKPTATPGITATPDVTAPPEVDNFALTETSVYVKNEDELYIKGICEKTSASELLSNFVYGSKLSVISENTYVGTGSVITDGKRQFTVIQLGDINGDGKVTSTDYIMIKKTFSGAELSYYKFIAADINGDRRILSNDYMRIKSYFRGAYNLYG